MASERPSVEHNVRLLIQEGQYVLREYRLEQLQADLFKLALSKELGAPIATEDEIDDYQFESAINGAFHLECVVLELAHYLLQDRSLSGMVETHIVSFAHLAARTYEYLGSYCEQAKNLRITNLFMHAMFNYALSLHGANAKAQILRQKADQMFARQVDYRYQVQDPLENFALTCDELFLLFASRQLGKCTEQFTAVVQQFAKTERRYGDAGILDGKCAPIGVFRAWANKQLADVVIKFANIILFGKLDEYPSLQRDAERIKEAILKFGDGVSLWVAEQIQFNMEQIIQHSTWRLK